MIRGVCRPYMGLIVVWFLASSALGQNQTQSSSHGKIPGWYLNPPVVGGTVVAAAAGETKMDATVRALTELASVMEVAQVKRGKADNASIDTFSGASRVTLQTNLGRIRIASMSNGTEGKNDRQSTRIQTSRIVFTAGTDTLTIKSFMEESDDLSRFSHTFSITGENLTFNSLLDEMKRAGVEMKTSESGSMYYVLLRYRLPKELE